MTISHKGRRKKATTAVTDLRQQTAHNFDCYARTVVLPVVPICRGSAFLIATPNQRQIHRYPVPLKRGVCAIVTDVGCGMRWTRVALLTRALPADGEVVWS